MPHKKKVLIVEDEVLIADSIANMLLRNGYEVLESAISFQEAITLFDCHQPDITLLDIRLSGAGSGIDVANYIREKNEDAAFIFLTSQKDRRYLDAAKPTRPAGYLNKPIQPANLLSMLEIALYNASSKSSNLKPDQYLLIGNSRIKMSNIKFLKAEHVYVRIFTGDGNSALYRTTLSELLEKLQERHFIRTHRSFIVNLNWVTGYDEQEVKLGKDRVPVSRANRRKVLDLLR